MEDLKTYLINMPDRTQKQTLCVMPKLDYKPKDLEKMADYEFYIINGQHSVAASKSIRAKLEYYALNYAFGIDPHF